MKVSDFDYQLPRELIAQHPVTPRDAARLMVLNRAAGTIEHGVFHDLLAFLNPGDVLVANDTRVIPARLFARKQSGGRVELLLLERLDDLTWNALVGGRNVKGGARLAILSHSDEPSGIFATIEEDGNGASRRVRFSRPVAEWITRLGYTPLPPYIHERTDDPEHYQTIYSRVDGSAAAPTAGLHFTSELLLALREKGVLFDTCTLHVGLDTFKPVTVDDVVDHTIHTEWATLTPAAAQRINEAALAGGRIVAVGTTTARVLETAALRSAGISSELQTISRRDAEGETFEMCPWRPVAAFEGRTDLYIYPGYRFRAVGVLITNFHLPRSSLLMLVAAFAGRDQIMHAYEVAVNERYRFYSFGDAMLII